MQLTEDLTSTSSFNFSSLESVKDPLDFLLRVTERLEVTKVLHKPRRPPLGFAMDYEKYQSCCLLWCTLAVILYSISVNIDFSTLLSNRKKRKHHKWLDILYHTYVINLLKQTCSGLAIKLSLMPVYMIDSSPWVRNVRGCSSVYINDMVLKYCGPPIHVYSSHGVVRVKIPPIPVGTRTACTVL